MIELLDQFCEISNVAADSIQAVNYDGPKVMLLGIGHHLLKLWAFQRTSRKTFIFIDQGIIGGGISKLHTDILLAHFDLVFDTFSFPCKFGFSGVDYELSVDFHLCHLIMLYILKYCIIASTIHQ